MDDNQPAASLKKYARRTHHRQTGQSVARLSRTTFKTSRLLDFCSEKELTAQTGHERGEWPLVALKELLDNALDACEEAGFAPAVGVTVDGEGIAVADNGPGLPPGTIDGILDFSARVSSREAYLAPTRGAQGNALKTILAMPFVLDGKRGRVDITAKGQRHEMTFSADRIAQRPVVTREVLETGLVRNGTEVKLWWPDSACSELRDAERAFLQLAADYAALNPHLTLSVDWFGERTETEATDTAWPKWLPSAPTPAHWYGSEELERLACAYIAHDRERGVDRAVREFIGEFRGLSGTAKQKNILERTGLARTSLSHLANGDGLRRDLVVSLLSAMQDASKPVKPAALGAIGAEHVEKRFAAAGCEPETLAYRKLAGVTVAGLPFLVEGGFAWRGEGAAGERRLVAGVNWSPGIVNPFRSLGNAYGDGLAALLEKRRAGRWEPVIVLVHCACPRVRYADRGKATAAIDAEIQAAVVTVVEGVTKQWTKQRKAEERGSRAARRDALVRTRRTSIKEAAWQILPEAYRKASGDGRLPAGARQIFYPARGPILEATGRDEIDSQYFCQTVLPEYVVTHRELTRDWDVVYDARGHLTEPHTRKIVGLGTLDVRAYLRDIETHIAVAKVGEFITSDNYPTCGPDDRFGAVLFIEKEGFLPLFEAVHLAERYDVAIMSTKGMPVVACLHLADELCGRHHIPLLVLHDFDKSGLSIYSNLTGEAGKYRNFQRYQYRQEFRTIDLGLRLADVKKYGLDSEVVAYRSDPKPNLARSGATPAEIAFLSSEGPWQKYVGRRVELNAFTSPAFVAWIEAKLTKHGVKKVLPDDKILKVAYRRAVQLAHINRQLPELLEEAARIGKKTAVPRSLQRKVATTLKRSPEMSWDEAVAELVRNAMRDNEPEVS